MCPHRKIWLNKNSYKMGGRWRSIKPPPAPISLGVKAKVRTMNYKAPQDLQGPPCPDLIACYSSPSLTLLESPQLLGHIKQASTSGPLHLLFPLLGILLPHLLFSFTFKCHHVSNASQEHQIKNGSTLSLPPALYFQLWKSPLYLI